MPGKTFSHLPLRHLLGAITLACLLLPGVAAASDTEVSSGTGACQADSVPSWCHKNLQLLSQLTTWRGYRDATLVKRKFSSLFSAPTFYRGYVADRNVFAFSSEIPRDNPHVDLAGFAVPDGEFNLGGPRPRASAVSIGQRGSTYETLIWNVVDFGLVAVRASNPATVGSHDQANLDVIPRDLHVTLSSNRYTIYTVNGTDSIRVYTLPVTSWVIVQRRGVLDTPGDATGLTFQNSRLYVADGSAGVQIVDASNIDDLQMVGHTDTRGPAKRIALMDTLMFVAEWDEGVEVFSVANLDSIRALAWVDTPGLAHDVAVDSTGFFYVADWDGGLRVYNYANLDSIFLDGFYGIGEQYHSVAVMDSIVFAGDYSGFMILRHGEDREPPGLSVTVTQTPFLRKYLRTYVHASECLGDVPTVRHLVLPRQATVEDFEGYADSDTLKQHWTAVSASDTVSLATTGFEGSQSMKFQFAVPKNSKGWSTFSFAESRDWRTFDRFAFNFKTAGDSIRGWAQATLFTAAGDTILGPMSTIRSDWQEYSVNLSRLDPRTEVKTIRLGVVSARADSTIRGAILFDHLRLKRVNVEEPAKGYAGAFQGDTLDVDVAAVSEERFLYMGDFELVASDSGFTNAILVTAGDLSGNTSTQMTEYRAQLVVPAKGGSLWSPNSRLSVHVPAGSTGEDAFFYILPEKAADHAAVPAGARAMGRPHLVGSSAAAIRQDIEMVFHLETPPAADIDPADLGVYRKDGNDWVYVGGRYNPEDRTVRARTRELGTVALLANPNRPGAPVPERVRLECYPNPFNPATTLSYASPSRSRVMLRVYDVGGRLVKTLVDEVKGAGTHFVTWDGRDDSSVPATSGIYFARLEVGGEIHTVKLVLVR